MIPELPDQIERASDENRVLRGCFGQQIVQGLLCIGDNAAASGMVRGDFTELRSGDGARGARLGKDHLGCVWEEHAGDFIDRFIAQVAARSAGGPAGD